MSILFQEAATFGGN